MNPKAKIRRASLEHLPALLVLERACSEAAHWSEAAWRTILQQSDTTRVARAVFVAGADEALLGFVVVQRVSASAELENLAVRPEKRRQGVAAALCRAAIAWASGEIDPNPAVGERGHGERALEMHLELRASNQTALRFYAVLGFAEQGRRAAYYSDPVEDAVLMSRSLVDPSGATEGSVSSVNTPSL